MGQNKIFSGETMTTKNSRGRSNVALYLKTHLGLIR
jgi:hypothetical protein